MEPEVVGQLGMERGDRARAPWRHSTGLAVDARRAPRRRRRPARRPGARMNTAVERRRRRARRRRGRPRTSRPGGRRRCGARRCRWRRSCAGRAGRRATSAASRIIPAQVPSAGSPSARRSASGSNSPDESSSIDIVVDSPPGMTSASTPSSSVGRADLDGVGAERQRAPRRARANAPCSARTPTFGRTWGPRGRRHARYQPRSASLTSSSSISSPASASPRPAADLGQDVRRRAKWVVASTMALARARGVVALEDARADEHRLGAELHHERGVGRGGDAAGAEQRHRQLAGLGDLLHERRAGPAAAWPSRTARPSRPG